MSKVCQKSAGVLCHSCTDALVVVDQWGNMAVVNHTINSVLWGGTGIFVDGVSIPDSASFQGGEIAEAGPGTRLPNGMSPLILLRDGKPVLGCAAVGGALHAKTLQVLVNILDFDKDPQTAVDTPAFVGWNAGTVEQDTFDPKVLDGLSEFGRKVRPIPSKDANMSRGYWVGIQIDPASRHMKGGVTRSGRTGRGLLNRERIEQVRRRGCNRDEHRSSEVRRRQSVAQIGLSANLANSPESLLKEMAAVAPFAPSRDESVP